MEWCRLALQGGTGPSARATAHPECQGKRAGNGSAANVVEPVDPIVTMTVVGGHALMPRGSPIARHGTLRITFGEPIATAGHSETDLEPLQQAVVASFGAGKRGG